MIRAREFQMVDKDGRVLAGMRMKPQMDGPIVYAKGGFHLVDDTGYVRAAMQLDGGRGGPAVAFWSNDHKRKLVELSLDGDDNVTLILASKTGKHQVTVQTSDDGPTVGLADADGRAGQIIMSVRKAGQAVISLNGQALVPAGGAKK